MTVSKMFAVAEKKEINTEERSVVAWASRPVMDRDKEVIAHDAWDLANFNKNPVLLVSHDYSRPPVGKVLWTKMTPEGLKFKAQFAKTQTGEELWQLYSEGVMQAFSVGFIAKKSVEVPYEERAADEPWRTFVDVELLEISCVSVPSCPEAVVIMNSKGLIKTKDVSDAILEVLRVKAEVEKEEQPDGEQEKDAEEAQETKEGPDDAGSVEEEKEVIDPEVKEDDPLEVKGEEPEEEKSDELKCTGCGLPLPITMESVDLEADDVECDGCGRRRKPKKDPDPEVVTDTVVEEITTAKLMESLIVVAKAGRALSEKNRNKLQQAISILTDLMGDDVDEDDGKSVEPTEPVEPVFDISDLVQSKIVPQEELSVGKDEFANMFKDALGELLEEHKSNLDRFVSNSINKAKGRMF
jgi:HK97 family phage prohead protease